MDIFAGLKGHLRLMVDAVQGMKALIVDSETLGIVSMVLSHTEILEREIFLTERLDGSDSAGEGKRALAKLSAICFLRPTNQNFLLLGRELQNPRYTQYHIFFTNCVPEHRLEQLAHCDESESVQQVRELFADVHAISPDLFSVSLPGSLRLAAYERSRWTAYEESLHSRIVEALFAVCVALKVMPLLRYTSSSEVTQTLACKLQERIAEEPDLFNELSATPGGRPALLILDRRDDPVTPLLNQWTYQAMAHELLTLEYNRIDMSKCPDIRPDIKDVVMSTAHDDFFRDNVCSNYGDLVENIKKYVEEYQSTTKNTSQIDSLEGMQRFVDEYPEFRKLSGNVSKHVAVAHELSRLINTQGLFDASQLEQDLACSERPKQHLQEVMDMLRGSSITDIERLRLVLLYSLRYEDEVAISQLKELLQDCGMSADQIGLIDRMKRHAGSSVRSEDLFGNKSVFARQQSFVSRSIKGVENVYTQHKSQLHARAELLMRGKLKEASFPFVDRGPAKDAKEPLPAAIIFVVGGATYEEARDVMELNRTLEGRRVLLGGSTFLNSQSFLAEVAQLDE